MKIYKDWNKMSDLEKKTEKTAIILITVVLGILVALFILAL